ncbi:hypothetical protein D3C71_1640340 [compost metagenome]
MAAILSFSSAIRALVMSTGLGGSCCSASARLSSALVTSRSVTSTVVRAVRAAAASLSLAVWLLGNSFACSALLTSDLAAPSALPRNLANLLPSRVSLRVSCVVK